MSEAKRRTMVNYVKMFKYHLIFDSLYNFQTSYYSVLLGCISVK